MPQSKSAKSDGKANRSQGAKSAKSKPGKPPVVKKPLSPAPQAKALKSASKSASKTNQTGSKGKPAASKTKVVASKVSLTLKKGLPAVKTASKKVLPPAARPKTGTKASPVKPTAKASPVKTATKVSPVKPAAKVSPVKPANKGLKGLKISVKKVTPAPIKTSPTPKSSASIPPAKPATPAVKKELPKAAKQVATKAADLKKTADHKTAEASKPAPKGKTPSVSVSQPEAKPEAATPKKAGKTAVGAKKTVPPPVIVIQKRPKPIEPTDPWVIQQRDKIYQLRDSILESMHGVAKDTLRSRAEGSEASAFGMHQADAGSDAYDRDFALSLLSQEQDALYEIEEALKRIELGTYGVCEMSGKTIMVARLEALPFARYTVECQAEVERQKKLHKARMPVTSLFGLTDEEAAESEEEDQSLDSKE